MVLGFKTCKSLSLFLHVILCIYYYLNIKERDIRAQQSTTIKAKKKQKK